jgi:hypothetical protein
MDGTAIGDHRRCTCHSFPGLIRYSRSIYHVDWPMIPDTSDCEERCNWVLWDRVP